LVLNKDEFLDDDEGIVKVHEEMPIGVENASHFLQLNLGDEISPENSIYKG
jgi:hypothetical protein